MTLPTRRNVGFLPSLGKLSLWGFLWPEGFVALGFGVGGGAVAYHLTKVPERVNLVNTAYPVLGVLLGVVFAALALLISFPTDEHVRRLDEGTPGGIIGFYRPFIVAIGLQVTTIFLGIAYVAVAVHVVDDLEHAAFLVWTFLLSYVLADVVGLTRNVVMHGLVRAMAAKTGNGGSVRSIRDKQG